MTEFVIDKVMLTDAVVDGLDVARTVADTVTLTEIEILWDTVGVIDKDSEFEGVVLAEIDLLVEIVGKILALVVLERVFIGVIDKDELTDALTLAEIDTLAIIDNVIVVLGVNDFVIDEEIVDTALTLEESEMLLEILADELEEELLLLVLDGDKSALAVAVTLLLLNIDCDTDKDCFCEDETDCDALIDNVIDADIGVGVIVLLGLSVILIDAAEDGEFDILDVAEGEASSDLDTEGLVVGDRVLVDDSVGLFVTEDVSLDVGVKDGVATTLALILPEVLNVAITDKDIVGDFEKLEVIVVLVVIDLEIEEDIVLDPVCDKVDVIEKLIELEREILVVTVEEIDTDGLELGDEVGLEEGMATSDTLSMYAPLGLHSLAPRIVENDRV